MNLSFTVYGTPIQQGNLRAGPHITGQRTKLYCADGKKLRPWRQEVAGTAQSLMDGAQPTRDAVEVVVHFYFAKPKSTPKRIEHKTTKPDIDKLERGILDALTGIAFHDDAQVVSVRKTKQFGLPERAELTVRTIEGGIEI